MPHVPSQSCSPRRLAHIGIYRRNIGKNSSMRGCVMRIRICMNMLLGTVEDFGLMLARLLSAAATYCLRNLRLLRPTFSQRSSRRSVLVLFYFLIFLDDQEDRRWLSTDGCSPLKLALLSVDVKPSQVSRLTRWLWLALRGSNKLCFWLIQSVLDRWRLRQ